MRHSQRFSNAIAIKAVEGAGLDGMNFLSMQF